MTLRPPHRVPSSADAARPSLPAEQPRKGGPAERQAYASTSCAHASCVRDSYLADARYAKQHWMASGCNSSTSRRDAVGDAVDVSPAERRPFAERR